MNDADESTVIEARRAIRDGNYFDIARLLDIIERLASQPAPAAVREALGTTCTECSARGHGHTIWPAGTLHLQPAPAAVPSAGLDAEVRSLLREAIEELHQVGLVSDHHDPSDKTGWNVHGIETCAYPLCRDSLAALAQPKDGDQL